MSKKHLPYRKLFDKEELKAVVDVFRDCEDSEQDFGYEGKFEKLYTDQFCAYQGGGYADAVCTGTAAMYVALHALGLKPGSDVIVPPVTDPGGMMPVPLLGLNPVVCDSQPNSFNMGPDQFRQAITRNTRAVIVAHIGGIAADMYPILKIAKTRGIKVIEDCSQAHGTLYKGRKVGNFGDIGVFSTVYAKSHASGGCGGIAYTRNKKYYWNIRSFADRGKPYFKGKNYDPKDPRKFLYPALNLNQDDLSCAIGMSTLSKLPKTIKKRLWIVKKINERISSSRAIFPISVPNTVVPSLFFQTYFVREDKIAVSKKKFTAALISEGLWINPDYKYVVSEWGWMKNYMKPRTRTPNATNMRRNSFNLLFNERFGEAEVDKITRAILKTERRYGTGDA